jgi:hypothetical protein
MAGVGSRPGRRLSRTLSRGSADGHRGGRRVVRPASLSTWLLAVTRVSGTAASRSVRVARPTVPIVLPRRDHMQVSYVLATFRALHPLILPGKPIGTYQVGRSVIGTELGIRAN